jgi:hypothetical protein
MEHDEFLKLMRKAEADWSRPLWKCRLFGYKGTRYGLNTYFKELDYPKRKMISFLMKNSMEKEDAKCHGMTVTGRANRLKVIRSIICELESK